MRPAPDERPWHFPVEQRTCIRLVDELAESLGRTVMVIDVNWPEFHTDLVERWVGPNTLLPLLVAPDGRRLEGLESFVPSIVRRFLSQP